MTRRTGWMLAAAIALGTGPRAMGDDERGAMQRSEGAGKRGGAEEGSGATRATPTPKTGVATTEAGKADRPRDGERNTEAIRSLYSQNTLDLETARLAKERSQDEQVKQFADRVARTHERLGEKLEELAGGRGVTLSRGKALEGGKQAHIEDMKRMSASEFDRHFKEMMVADHEKLLRELGTALDQANATGDLELAAVLQDAKPTLQEQHQSALTLGGAESQRGSMGSGGAGADAPAQAPPAQAPTAPQGEPMEKPKPEGQRY